MLYYCRIGTFFFSFSSDLDNMHKVVLEVPSEADLQKVAEKLTENGVREEMIENLTDILYVHCSILYT